MMKLNQFNCIVKIATPPTLKQTNNGMNILEFVGQTQDGKQFIQFTAFKETAESLKPKLHLDSVWACFGTLSGRGYQDKSGTTRYANGCIVSAAIKVEDAPHLAADVAVSEPSFSDEDMPF